MSISIKNTTINVRIAQQEKEVFAAAAELSGTSLSDFAINAVRAKAEEILLNRTEFQIFKDEHWKTFNTALDDTTDVNEAFRRKINKSTPWDE